MWSVSKLFKHEIMLVVANLIGNLIDGICISVRMHNVLKTAERKMHSHFKEKVKAKN